MESAVIDRRYKKDFVVSSMTAMQIEQFKVLGVKINVLDQERTREFLFDAVRQGQRGYVTITNVYSVSEALRDADLKRIFNEALLSTPDGMPMVWMGRLLGHPSIRRVYGPDLVLNLCDHAVRAELPADRSATRRDPDLA
jgi:N-acetylglucosaminyldiphosphoundecaprenol N-acetyl-beta-D-mannosaminyltransferase